MFECSIPAALTIFLKGEWKILKKRKTHMTIGILFLRRRRPRVKARRMSPAKTKGRGEISKPVYTTCKLELEGGGGGGGGREREEES